MIANQKNFNYLTDNHKDVLMMPGMRGINPRQMKQAMKRMGITTEDINDVVEVVIRTKTKEYIIKEAAVTVDGCPGPKDVPSYR